MTSSTPQLRHVTTARLRLDVPDLADLPTLHALYADPRVWRHAPEERFTEPAQTERLVRRWLCEWDAHGLSSWTVRSAATGELLGNAGCGPRDGWWSLGYRFRPEAQGRGQATEAARRAVDAAHEVDRARPVVASLLAHNEASRALAERLGLTVVFRGPDLHHAGSGGIRLLYADRPMPPDLVDAIRHGTGRPRAAQALRPRAATVQTSPGPPGASTT